jgi:hypothetical protein
MSSQISILIDEQGNCRFNLRDTFERMQNRSKLMLKVGQKRAGRVGIFYRELPLHGVNMLLISGFRPNTSVYISIFKVDLAGNKRLIELRYEMYIITFKLLFKFKIS